MRIIIQTLSIIIFILFIPAIVIGLMAALAVDALVEIISIITE